MRRTIGATTRTAGNAMSHDESHADIQLPKKFEAKPIARNVATHETRNDIKPDSKNPNAMGSRRRGMNGRNYFSFISFGSCERSTSADHASCCDKNIIPFNAWIK